MKTIEIIAMVWSVLGSFFILVAKLTGVNPFIGILMKFLSLVTIIYFGWRIVILIP